MRRASPRLFSFIDWASTPDRFEDARFASLQSFMLLGMLAHSLVLVRDPGDLGGYARFILVPIFALSAGVGLRFPGLKAACVALTFATTSLWLFLAAPNFANHLFLEWSILLFLTLCRNDVGLGLNGLRWLGAIVLFYSGFQKFLMGQYFEGQFLLVRVAVSPKFRRFFEFVLPDAEVERLVEMGGRFGTGPYATSDPLFLTLSNGVWLGEMSAAVLLIIPKTRKLGLILAILLVAGIELAARELVFGCVFTVLLLTFYQGKNAIRLWAVFSIVQFLSVASRLVWPGMRFN